MSATPRSDMSPPPAVAVEWTVFMPSLNLAESVERRAKRVVRKGGTFLSRRVARTVHVIARTWFEARHEAAIYWARKGVHFSPQSIRDGEMV